MQGTPPDGAEAPRIDLDEIERLARASLVAKTVYYPFDTETYPIHPGRLAPPVVCLQDEAGIHVGPGIRARAERAVRSGVVLVGHVVAYDMAVLGANYPDLLPEIFAAYAADRVVCTRVREKLIRIAQGRSKVGGYSLVECCEAHRIDHGYNVDTQGHKAEAWRVRYAELEGIPVADWPADARRYAELDVTNARALYEAQDRAAPAEWFIDQYRQTRADFALHLMTCWGLRTDPDAVAAFAEALEREHADTRAVLTAAGLVRPDGSKDTSKAKARMEAVCRAAELPVRMTKEAKGRKSKKPHVPQVSLDNEACEGSGDPVLMGYARYGSIGTLRSRAERLTYGTVTPLQPRYDILKETGRTSCSQGEAEPGKPVSTWGFQVQNVHREPGLRECFVPRPGHLLLSSDWGGAELHSFAQVCIWMGLNSRMAERLNAGMDLHLDLGASMLGQSYEWALAHKKEPEVKNARQAAKPGNFGFPGGMGDEAFRSFSAATYGVIFSPSESRILKARWFERNPEAHGYFERINALVESGRPIKSFMSGRFRGGATYCAACNNFFQGLTADMAKDAAFELARACYVGGGVLSGARPVAFIHDEFLVEVPEHTAHECALAVQQIMEDAGRKWCPDVPVRAEPALMRRWSKGAEPKWSNGRLIAWEDET